MLKPDAGGRRLALRDQGWLRLSGPAERRQRHGRGGFFNQRDIEAMGGGGTATREYLCSADDTSR